MFEKELKAGDRFTFSGMEWICLDPDYQEKGESGVFAIGAKVIDEGPFNRNGSADYRDSDIRKPMNKIADLIGRDKLITHTVDLAADNGDKRLGTVEDDVFILSVDEYRKYRDYVPHYEEWMWTCTPWYIDAAGSANYPRNVVTSGTVSSSNANFGHGRASACIIKKSEIAASAAFREADE